MLAVSYHTELYAREGARLARSCGYHQIELKQAQVKDRGSWNANCHYKPYFIRSCLNAYSNQRILFVDADAEFRAYPEWLEEQEDFDIAVRRRPNRNNEVLSGTLCFNQTDAARAILDEWERENEAWPDRWDQKNLQAVLERVEHKCLALPPEYAAFDLVMQHHENLVPVIWHHQASRRLRRKANGQKQ